MADLTKFENKFCKVCLKEEHRQFYSPRNKNLEYYGLVWDVDDRHILMKTFLADLEGNILWGGFNKFMIDSVHSIEELEE